MPLPNTRVIVAAWSPHHRPTATDAMTATCEVTRRASGGTTDADGNWTPATATTIYTGQCRVQALVTRQQVDVVGEAQETRRRYLVAIRHDTATIHIGDLVAVSASVDASLPGRKLRVTDVSLGSEQWQRDLSCEELED